LVTPGRKTFANHQPRNYFISLIRKIFGRLPSKFHFYKTNLYFVFKKPRKSSEKAILFKVQEYGFLKKWALGGGRQVCGPEWQLSGGPRQGIFL